MEGTAVESGRRKALRRKIADRDGPTCWLCNGLLDPDTASLDHVIPKALGGTYRQDNLRLAHKSCNNRRGSRIPAPRFRRQGN